MQGPRLALHTCCYHEDIVLSALLLDITRLSLQLLLMLLTLNYDDTQDIFGSNIPVCQSACFSSIPHARTLLLAETRPRLRVNIPPRIQNDGVVLFSIFSPFFVPWPLDTLLTTNFHKKPPSAVISHAFPILPLFDAMHPCLEKRSWAA